MQHVVLQGKRRGAGQSNHPRSREARILRPVPALLIDFRQAFGAEREVRGDIVELGVARLPGQREGTLAESRLRFAFR